jgi:ubiquinone/menaquinone biosynthesis C-methylase UbiE
MEDNGYYYLARVYDRLTSDIDYDKVAKYTLENCRRYLGRLPYRLLDLACGTGSHAIAIAKKGIEVTGIDISDSMLTEAIDKSTRAKTNILFSKQDMSSFEIHGRVDVITCCFDSVNHILDPSCFGKMLKNVDRYLVPGGLFIFDVNSEYKFKKIYGNNVYTESFDDLTFIWQNHFDKNSGIVEFEMTFFTRQTDGRYVKHMESNYERLYTLDEIDSYIKCTSLEQIAMFDGFSFKALNRRSQRISYILKKPE